MGKKYQKKVSHIIRNKVGYLLLASSKDPRLSEVTITDVSVNRDTSRAEIYYSIIGTPEDVAEMQAVLDGAAGWLRAELAPTLRLRNIPKLVFKYDPSLEYGGRIDALLGELLDDDEDNEDDEDITDDGEFDDTESGEDFTATE